MDNRLTFTADFYNTNKVDMLFPLLLPTSSGAGQNSNVILNIGDMNNKGMEFALGYRQSGRFEWGVSATYSKNVNKVTKMSETNKFSYFANGTAVITSYSIHYTKLYEILFFGIRLVFLQY